MIRKCEHIISTKDGKRAIYVDSINKQEILTYINQDERHKKKFQYITDIILGGHKNTSLYDKEDINENDGKYRNKHYPTYIYGAVK